MCSSDLLDRSVHDPLHAFPGEAEKGSRRLDVSAGLQHLDGEGLEEEREPGMLSRPRRLNRLHAMLRTPAPGQAGHEFGRELGGQMFVPMEHFGGEVTPVIGLTPLVANIIAKDGYSKDDVRRFVFEHATVPAREADVNLNRHQRGLDLHESVRLGRLPPVFAQSRDPDRRVPVVHHPGEINIVVTGSPDRNRSFIAAQFGHQGLRVSRRIALPEDWSKRLRHSEPG